MQVKIDPTCLFLMTLGRLVILLSLGKMLGRKKTIQTPFPFDKKIQEPRIGSVYSFSMIQSDGIKNLVNK